MMSWLWLVAAVAAAIGETLTYDLFLASVAVAALITAASVFVLPLGLQVGLFAVLALVGIFVVRPAAKAALGMSNVAQGHPGLRHPFVVGRRAVVTHTVTEDGGQIRIGQGEFWSARAYEPSDLIEAGQPVRVMLVEGVTALVEPIPDSDSVTEDESKLLTEKGS
jgi:membrane protein implicated in regulation of membrane protease activity